MKKFLPVILITALIATMFVFTNAGAASYKLGDVDLNGQVLANDARSILRYSARLEADYDELQLTLADVNGIDGINAADARIALRMSARLEEEITIEIGEEPSSEPVSEEPSSEPVSEEPSSEPVSEEPSSEPVPGDDRIPFDQLPTAVKALLEGKFGIEGRMIVGSGMYAETLNANMYTDGTNIKMSVDGEELGMTGMLTLIIREEKGLLGITTSKHMYMLNDDAKTYFEINEAAMKLIGLDMDDLDMDFDLGMLGGSAGASAVLSKETVDGVEYDVYAFNNEEQGTTTKMYMDGDKLVMFEMFDQEGELTSRYEIDKFVPYPGEGEFEVPSGYKKQSILKFFGENI